MRLTTHFCLLLGDTNSATATTCGFGVLTTNTKTKVMTYTTMRAYFAQSVHIFAVLEVKLICNQLHVLSVTEVFLPIEEVIRDMRLARILNDGHNTVHFGDSKCTRTLG